MYNENAKKFIKKLIKIRERIIREKKSIKPVARMNADIEFLQIHLNAYNYTDRTMAGFFIRNSVKIQEIIPTYSDNSNKLTDEFRSLLHEAQIIYKQYQTA